MNWRPHCVSWLQFQSKTLRACHFGICLSFTWDTNWIKSNYRRNFLSKTIFLPCHKPKRSCIWHVSLNQIFVYLLCKCFSATVWTEEVLTQFKCSKLILGHCITSFNIKRKVNLNFWIRFNYHLCLLTYHYINHILSERLEGPGSGGQTALKNPLNILSLNLLSPPPPFVLNSLDQGL